jgi:hypothetical protein
MPSLNLFKGGKRNKRRDSGSFFSRLVGGLREEEEPYIPFRQRYVDSRPTTPDTEATEEPALEEQQTVQPPPATAMHTRPPLPETFRRDINYEEAQMQQQQMPPPPQTSFNHGMTVSSTLVPSEKMHQNPMARNSAVIDTGPIVAGKMRFRSPNMIRNSTFHHGDSPTTPEFGDDNDTAVRRLNRRDDRPTERGFERQYFNRCVMKTKKS